MDEHKKNWKLIYNAPEEGKWCNGCGEWYPLTLDYWYKGVSTKDGLSTRCKFCLRKKSLERYHNLTDEQKKRRRDRRREWRKRPHVRAKRLAYSRDYFQRPAVKEKRTEYSREYEKKPEVIERRRYLRKKRREKNNV